jgi:hypothetical protein
MDEYQSLTEVKAAVDAQGGVLSMPAWVIRNAYGAERLGAIVRVNISKSLRGIGLGHVPIELPDRSDELVRVFKLGSPVADLIEAVLEPGTAGDDALLQASGGNAANLLAQIRELVCE